MRPTISDEFTLKAKPMCVCVCVCAIAFNVTFEGLEIPI